MSFPALQWIRWKPTWWETTQEESHTNVASATSLALLLVFIKAEWYITQEIGLSSATNAAKVTKRREVLQYISKFTWLRSDCYTNISSSSSMHDLVDTLVALNHSFPKQKLTKLIMIKVGNPDDWCTQNCLPQDCLPVGNSEVGNPEGIPINSYTYNYLGRPTLIQWYYLTIL